MSKYEIKAPHGGVVISGKNPGPRVGIMAITHGDEPAGMEAYKNLISYFEKEELENGELILLLGNPNAYNRGKICIEENLNRMFQEDSFLTHKQKNSQEYMRSRELMKVIEGLDYLLDIHSTNNPGPVFAIIKNDTPKHWEIASLLPVEFVSEGWNPYITGTTCDWIEKFGGIGITIECGSHNNPEGGHIAFQAAKCFLQGIGVHNWNEEINISKRCFQVLLKESVSDAETFEYTRYYKNFESIGSNEIIAHDSLRTYTAPEEDDLAIVFPTSIESIRSGAIKEAYLLGKFYEKEGF